MMSSRSRTLEDTDVDRPQNVISFCSGYGGIELGLRRAGVDVRTVSYVEIEAFCQANLANKIEEGWMDSAPIWSDLKTFPAESFYGKVDGITGGYPCQPFSNAGKRAGEDDPRHLWPYIRKHIQTISPRWVFLENVEGHLSLGLSTVISDLDEDGYDTTWGIFSAEEIGAPHQRKRVFILAVQRGSKEMGDPASERSCGGCEDCEEEQPKVSRSGSQSDDLWPARPSQPQHDWEEPRVVADGKDERCGRGKNQNRTDEQGLQIKEGKEQ